MIHLSDHGCSNCIACRDLHVWCGANPRCRKGLPTGSDDIIFPKSSVKVYKESEHGQETNLYK